MDSIQKFLKKLSPKQRSVLLDILSDTLVGRLDGYDVKKLTNQDDMYRVRIGQIRIIFRKTDEWIVIVNIDFRGSIYKK